MKEEKSIKISGSLISISEKELDPSRKVAKFLLCPLDEANLNGKGIKESDLSEEEIKTLVGQPLVTKVIFDEKTKEYNFAGHLMTKKWKYDENGTLIKFSDFTSTSPIGYHTSISIENIEFGEIVKRCLVAEVVLWTRYYRAMEVIERLGTSLHTSWELSYSETYKENETEWLKGILFLANCVLGSNINPAYKDAGLLECAEEENQNNEFVEAFINDLTEINQLDISCQSEEISVEHILEENNEGGHKIMAEENEKIEISSLTMDDLYTKLSKAIRKATDEDKWYYISRLYPVDFKVIAHCYADEDDKFVEFTYSVNEEGIVSVTGQKSVEMVFIPKEDNDTSLSELQAKLGEVNISLSTKVDEIVKLGETITSQKETIEEKDKAIAELEPLRLQMEQAETERKEAELSEKKNDLKKMALSSKYFTEEEIETCEELKKAIDEIDEKQIKCLIAERVVEQASKIEVKDKVEEISDKVVVSEVEISTDINTNNYDYKNSSDTLLNYARRNIKR